MFCTSDKGERFIIRIQKANHNFFKDRSVFYASFPIQEQAQKGQWNFKLDPVYSIGILDFIFDDHKEEEELLHIIELKNQRCEVFYKKLKFIYLELPKFKKKEEELETLFTKLFKAAEIAKFTPEERVDYEKSLMYFRDLENVVDTSREEGREEGRKEIAKELKANGVSVEVIMQSTGFSKKEIEKL